MYFPDLSISNLLSVFTLVMQRILNYYPNYPIHRLYFGKVEAPYHQLFHRCRGLCCCGRPVGESEKMEPTNSNLSCPNPRFFFPSSVPTIFPMVRPFADWVAPLPIIDSKWGEHSCCVLASPHLTVCVPPSKSHSPIHELMRTNGVRTKTCAQMELNPQ